MTRTLWTILSVATLSVAAGLPAQADDSGTGTELVPIAVSGTECLRVIVSSPDSIIATYEGNSATYSNDLYLMLDSNGNPGDDGNPGNDMFLFNNHGSPVGSKVCIGLYPVGTELIFRLHVNNTGNDFFTGPADRNPDGNCHARVQGNWMPGTTLASFEDLYNGPFNFNDLSFSFTNTGSVECPEPMAVAMVAYISALVPTGGVPPLTFEIVGGALPPGLVLDTATGDITGVPTTPGTFDFTATATDAVGGVATAECAILVVPPDPTQVQADSWGAIKSRYR